MAKLVTISHAYKTLAPAILAAIGIQVVCHGQDAIQPGALDELVDKAKKAHSDALVVWKDGKPYGEWYFGKPVEKIEAMSATKSVVSLAIGKLITDGRIKSVDQPVYEFYPEWKQGRKQNITIRHLMNHTSGLQNVATNTEVEIYPSPDFVQLALAAELSADPGTVFAYNNKAVNLLAGIVQKASGKRMDLYIRDTLFAPMGITNFTWLLDPAGNPHAMAGLQILPADFAKVGQLVLDRGKWDGKQLIAESWFDLSMQPGSGKSPTCGLLWWLLREPTLMIDDEQISKIEAKANESRSKGKGSQTGQGNEDSQWQAIDAGFLDKARQLKGKYEGRVPYILAIERVFGTDAQRFHSIFDILPKVQYGKTLGYYADGYLGQYLVIVPDARLVALRMIGSHDDYDQGTDGFMEFLQLVSELASPDSSPDSRR